MNPLYESQRFNTHQSTIADFEIAVDLEVFKERCFKEITELMNKRDELAGYGTIDFHWLFPNLPASKPIPNLWRKYDKEIDAIYYQLEDFFWNHYQVGLYFGGNQKGSGVELIYTDESEKRNEVVANNQSDFLLILANAVSKLQQLKNVPIGKTKFVNLDLRGISLTGEEWPQVMRAVSKELAGGRIIKVDGKFCVEVLAKIKTE